MSVHGAGVGTISIINTVGTQNNIHYFVWGVMCPVNLHGQNVIFKKNFRLVVTRPLFIPIYCRSSRDTVVPYIIVDKVYSYAAVLVGERV